MERYLNPSSRLNKPLGKISESLQWNYNHPGKISDSLQWNVDHPA